MKKVIVLLAVLAMVTPAMAADIDTSHSEAFGCGACHSAHVKVPVTVAGKITTDLSSEIPLWGRFITTDTTLSAYNSGTTTNDDITPGAPTNESALCMSCHDGTTNPGATGHQITKASGKAAGYIDTNVGHPISFTYTGQVESATFRASPTASGGALAVLEGGRMECTSCHDIHGTNVNSQPYAIRGGASVNADAEEDICKSCHIK